MTKKELLNVFKSLKFNLVDNQRIGTLVEISAEDAFVLSSVVGCSYMINQNGVTMKGRSEVFIHRSVFQKNYYIYSPGLFNRDLEGNLKEGNSLNVLQSMYPEIFKGNKYLLIKDIDEGNSSNIEVDTYKMLEKNKIDTKSILVLKNFETGSSFEPFLEYLASKYFIDKGYITETQVPWFQQSFKYKANILSGGIPDFSAFHCSTSNYLNLLGITSNGKGVALSLLPVITAFRNIKKLNEEGIKNIKDDKKYELIIGEAKSSRSSLDSAVNQLEKYRSVDLANCLYTIIPDVTNNRNNDIGEIYLNKNRLEIKNANKGPDVNKNHQAIDDEWLSNYIKILLLGNVKLEKIFEIINYHRENTKQVIFKKYEAHHLLDAILSIDTKNFIKMFLEAI